MTAVIETPTVRAGARRSLFWIVAAVFLVIVAVVVVAITGASKSSAPSYSATSATPSGSKAVAQVLGQHGVDVRVTGSLAAARSALSDGTRSTLMFIDENGYLNDDQLASLSGLARHVVLLTPSYSQLAKLAPGIQQAGAVAGKPLAARCALDAAKKAGTVSGGGRGYRVAAKEVGTVACFGSGNGTYSVIDVEHAGHRTTVVGVTRAFTNDHVADHGNAALSLGLLGDNPRLVWYQPSIDDVALTGKPTIAQLTPPWVSPVIVLLIITVIAAAVWRGRRMGPLIVENLPVTVRASETMEGRARLYQRGSARLRAIDALRIGALSRLASTSGLSRLATTDEIVSAVSSITATDPRAIRAVLIDDVPRTDRDLVALSDALTRLERLASDSVRSPALRSSAPQQQQGE